MGLGPVPNSPNEPHRFKWDQVTSPNWPAPNGSKWAYDNMYWYVHWVPPAAWAQMDAGYLLNLSQCGYWLTGLFVMFMGPVHCVLYQKYLFYKTQWQGTYTIWMYRIQTDMHQISDGWGRGAGAMGMLGEFALDAPTYLNLVHPGQTIRLAWASWPPSPLLCMRNCI
jgi:hypothetical protein